MKQAYEKYLQETLIDAETLQARVAELGAQISADYEGHDQLMLICILKENVRKFAQFGVVNRCDHGSGKQIGALLLCRVHELLNRCAD